MPEHVALEVPAIYAATQVVGDAPDSFVQFRPFGFFVVHSPNLQSIRILKLTASAIGSIPVRSANLDRLA